MQLRILLPVAVTAWVLWVQHESLGDAKVGHGYSRKWVPETSYPDDAYVQCVQDAKTLAERRAERPWGENVDDIAVNTLIGNRYSVHIKLKSGGNIWNRFVCFPHTVQPD